MAEDIFLNFFQGLGTGMEAGRERRTLMQRAQRGEISPQDVPGRFETMLTAMARAATPLIVTGKQLRNISSAITLK